MDNLSEETLKQWREDFESWAYSMSFDENNKEGRDLALTIYLAACKKNHKEIDKLRAIITDVHKSCLCTRNTFGFDYHQEHEHLGKPKTGGRWLTPVDLIEARIGFEWKYEKPEGVCRSWKELSFTKEKQKEKI